MIFRFSKAVLLILAADLPLMLVGTTQASGIGSLPQINLGDEWVYYEVWEQAMGRSAPLVVTATVQRMERFNGYDAYVLEYNAVTSSAGSPVYTFTRWVTADWLELKEVLTIIGPRNLTSTRIPTQPVKLLEAPLEVGRSWLTDISLEVSTTIGSETNRTTLEYRGVEYTVTSIVDLEVVSGRYRTYLVEQRHGGVLQSRRWISIEAAHPPLALDMRSIVKYEEYSQERAVVTGELADYKSRSVSLESLSLAGLGLKSVFSVAAAALVGYGIYILRGLVKDPQRRYPRHRLLKPLGCFLLAVGLVFLVLCGLIYCLAFNSSLIISRVLVEVLTGYSLLEWGAFFLSAGITPLIFIRSRYSPVLLAASTAAGILMIPATFKLLGQILAFQGAEYFFWTLMLTDLFQWGVGPGLVAGGVLTYLAASKDWPELSSRNIKVFDYAVVAATVFGIAFAFSPEVTSRILGLAAFTWVVWQFVTPKLVAVWVAGATQEQRMRTMSRYIFYVEQRGPIQFTAGGVFRRSILPLQMAFGVIPLIIKLFNITPKATGDIELALQTSAVMVRMAWFVIPTVIFVVGPLKWIFDESGVRRCDRLTRAYKDLSLGLFEEFVGVGSLISLLEFSYDTSGRVLEVTALLAFLIVITLLPITLLSTALYIRLSFNRHIKGFIDHLKQLGMEVIPVDLATVEPAKALNHAPPVGPPRTNGL